MIGWSFLRGRFSDPRRTAGPKNGGALRRTQRLSHPTVQAEQMRPEFVAKAMPDDDLASKIILMVGVALDELAMVEAEPDLAKTRIAIASVRRTLKELLTVAQANKDRALPR